MCAHMHYSVPNELSRGWFTCAWSKHCRQEDCEKKGRGERKEGVMGGREKTLLMSLEARSRSLQVLFCSAISDYKFLYKCAFPI